MSEYQYYEFQAVDRPLSAGEQEMLRGLSSRAQITATTFTNSYDWGDFKGDPDGLMRSTFDLHLYLANWGSHRLMLRVPKRLVDPVLAAGFLIDAEWADAKTAGEHLIIDVRRDEMDGDWEDGSGRLASLAPLRRDLMQGDLRMLYLVWLMGVEFEVLADDAEEPLPGIGPLSGALKAFADFFGIDGDLVDAAAELGMAALAVDPDAMRGAIAALPDAEKTGFLTRMIDGDPHAGIELGSRLRRQIQSAGAAAPDQPRTVAELRERAKAIGADREAAALREAAAAKRQAAEAEAKARQARLDTLRQRGDGAWREVEVEIDHRTAKSYANAAALLRDLRVLAGEQGTLPDFQRRLNAIRAQHASKRTFILKILDLG